MTIGSVIGSLFQQMGKHERDAEKKSPFADEWKKIGGYGDAANAYGGVLTEEGLGGLRGLRGTYASRLNDPLGEVGRGIFARARGQFSDDFTRTVNSGQARRAQLATQSGGAITPEQIAALDQETRRTAGEQKFRAEGQLAIGEADMTLSEMGKFFDRMEGIDRTMVGVGQDEKTRGLGTMLAAITGRQDRMNKIVGKLLGPWGG